MKPTIKLIDRNGKQSPAFDCEIYAQGSEYEIDAELSHEYVKTARMLIVIEHGEVIREHNVLGYSFCGDTIISGVHALRNGNYILSVDNDS